MNPERLDLVATTARQQISRVNAYLEMSNVIHAEQIRRNRATERVASATKLAYADPAGIDDGEDFMLSDATAATRLAADIANARDMTQRGGVWVAEPVVDIQEDDSLPQRITAAMDDADADEQEKRDRLIIRPERGDVSGEDAAVRKVEDERADWDRTNDGDRFE